MHQTLLDLEKDNRFVNLGQCRRIWAISSIHAQIQPLQNVHDYVFARFKAGDRIVYFGNYTGFGTQSVETVDEILSFRRALMANEGVRATDIVYLRGAQEEMLQKLLQVQFAPNPRLVIEWLLNNGMAQTLESYGICLHTLWRVAGEGVVQLSRWTGYLRNMMRQHPGHEIFSGQYVRAAYHAPRLRQTAIPALAALPASAPVTGTHNIPPIAYTAADMQTYEEYAALAAAGGGSHRPGRSNGSSSHSFAAPDLTHGQPSQSDSHPAPYTPLLFVSAGVDYGRPLTEQGDTLWWGGAEDFHAPHTYTPFARVFRGFDPQYKGIQADSAAVTLHSGDAVVGAMITPDGDISDIFES